MSNEVVIYWSNLCFNFLASKPDPAYIEFLKIVDTFRGDLTKSREIKRCPAVTDYLKNTFRVKCPVGYDILWDGEGFNTGSFDKNFWEEYVFVRDPGAGLITFRFTSTVFFTEEPSLTMETRSANYAINDFTTNATFLEGAFDIGRWFRPTDLAFVIKNKNVRINLHPDDTLFYVKFNTDKKIVFKKFNFTPELRQIQDDIIYFRSMVKKLPALKGMERFYSAFRSSLYKKRILKEIKNNLME